MSAISGHETRIYYLIANLGCWVWPGRRALYLPVPATAMVENVWWHIKGTKASDDTLSALLYMKVKLVVNSNLPNVCYINLASVFKRAWCDSKVHESLT